MFVRPYLMRIGQSCADASSNASTPATSGQYHKDQGTQLPDLELRSALLQLPMRQRQCVALRYYDDRTVDEIAQLLDVTPGSVKTHLHRGHARLRELLGGST